MSDCIEWTGACDRDGYGVKTVAGHQWRAHRLVWTQTYGTIDAGLCVCHTCDNPACVNLEHLFLGTVAENNDDKKRKGRDRAPRGEQHGAAKFTEAEIYDIRQRYAAGEKQRDIAADYGVWQAQISAIVLRKTWKQVA